MCGLIRSSGGPKVFGPIRRRRSSRKKKAVQTWVARRREGIVLLNEDNASLHGETDELLQSAIRDQLAEQTVIAAMHKLDAGHARSRAKTTAIDTGDAVSMR